MASGYIYILANSSMPGLVKIGKTSRLPSERADELSGVTGVATPFIVVYEEYFEDCDAAEVFVHTKMSASGLRLSETREFFRASVSDVVKTIASIHSVSGSKPSEPDRLDGLLTPDGPEFDGFELNEFSAPDPWDSLMEEADKHYYGLQGYIQDKPEAFRLYRDAARLGSPKAYQALGDMFQQGEGVREDAQRALDFYKEGAKKGNHFCYAGMAEIFIANGHSENARKALSKFVAGGEADGWKKYFDYPDCHIVNMQFILIRAFWQQQLGPELVSVLRTYLPRIMDLIRKELAEEDVKKGSPGRLRGDRLKLLATLESAL